MKQCKKIGCNIEFQLSDRNDYCPKCRGVAASNDEFLQQETISPETSSGGDNDYWVALIAQPKRLEPYLAECEDLIEHFQMTFQEGEAFKALWRKGQARIGNGKPGDTPLRNAEKVAHFGARMVAMESRKQIA